MPRFSLVASPCPGGGKAIAVKVGPEKSRQIYRHEIGVPVPVSAILDAKPCNNLVHFETIFMVKRSAKMVKLRVTMIQSIVIF